MVSFKYTSFFHLCFASYEHRSSRLVPDVCFVPQSVLVQGANRNTIQ